MDNKEFSKKLEVRTKKFAVAVIRFSASLPGSPESKVIRYQLTKSGSSIGANYHEANRARSKTDFSNKIRICEFEASETVYWLEVISELDWVLPEKVNSLLSEATELLAIFTSIGRSLKS
jgi:four helix bundle protein